jgi:hypothetical protein
VPEASGLAPPVVAATLLAGLRRRRDHGGHRAELSRSQADRCEVSRAA